jgi:hypothetical protein
MIKVIECKNHQIILYPGDGITDNKYGNGVIKDVALKDNDTIITVLYHKYFCVYFDEIRNENLIEAKRINPKYK